MDIVITYPSSTGEGLEPPSIERFEEQECTDHVFKLPSRPQLAKPGDKCYIGFDQRIQGYFYIRDLRLLTAEEAGDVHNYGRGAGWAVISDWEFYELADPKPRYKQGTPGFWYLQNAIKNGLITGFEVEDDD